MAGSSATGTSEDHDILKLAIPILFGTLVNWMLYGVLVVQTYVYSYNFQNDRLVTKSMVYLIFTVETAQTVLTGADIYYWFIGGFGDLERLHRSHYAAIDGPFMIGVSSLVVQMYFCHRIWTLTRNVWLCTAIAVMSIASTAGAFWGGSAALMGGKFAIPSGARFCLYLWSTGALADIIVAVAMTLQLRRASGGFCRFVLVRVVRLTIETNTLTASTAITAFVLYVAFFPNDFYCVFPISIIGKLYSNTLLVSLNNRIYFRDRSGSSRGGDTTHSTVASRVCTTGISSVDFSSAERQSRPHVEVIKLESFHTRDLKNGEGDSASINIPDPSHAPGNVIHMKTGPSIVQSSAHGGE